MSVIRPHYVAQPGFGLKAILLPQSSAGITVTSHHTQLVPLLEVAPNFLVTILKCVGENLALLQILPSSGYVVLAFLLPPQGLAAPLSLGSMSLAAPLERPFKPGVFFS